MTQIPVNSRPLTMREIGILQDIANSVPERAANPIVCGRTRMGMVFRRRFMGPGTQEMSTIRVYAVRDQFLVIFSSAKATKVRIPVRQPEALALLIKMES